MTATATIFKDNLSAYTASTQEISPEVISQRVKILTRFRELLEAQRDRFRDYLLVLDKQKDAIVQGSVEELTAHAVLEEKIALDIFSIQKVIDPLEALYRNLRGEDDIELTGLKAALAALGKDAAERTLANKELLFNRMATLRMEIKNLRLPTHPSIYGRAEEPSIIDIRG